MDKHSVIRNFGAAGIGLAFISVGVDHFVNPSWYEPIVPSVLGDARFWVLVSGLFEVIFGLFFIIPKTRAWASVGEHGYWLCCTGQISTCGITVYHLMARRIPTYGM